MRTIEEIAKALPSCGVIGEGMCECGHPLESHCAHVGCMGDTENEVNCESACIFGRTTEPGAPPAAADGEDGSKRCLGQVTVSVRVGRSPVVGEAARCVRLTKHVSGYCWQHGATQPPAPRGGGADE